MTSIPKDLEWRRTSRNTEIAVGKVAPYGKVFFKRGVLINSLELNKHIASFNLLNKITDKIDGATSPSIISQLSDGNVIALEYFSGKSFHELWSDKDYPKKDVLRDIIQLYEWLRKFHIATVFDNTKFPLCYGDFGPKNLIALGNDRVAFIDPPLNFVPREAHYDFGTLVFEIERSLIQSARANLILENRRLAQKWVTAREAHYWYGLYKKGIQSHVFSVVGRYGKFFKKPRPVRELLRGLCIAPCLILYHIVLMSYDAISKEKVK